MSDHTIESVTSVSSSSYDGHVEVAPSTSTVASSSTANRNSSSSSIRTLIHFKKNSRHAVSQALTAIKWKEVRLRIPKAPRKATATATAAANGGDSSEDEEDGENAAAGMDDADAAAAAVAAAAVSELKDRPRKVKQPKSLLLNLGSYQAFHPSPAAAASSSSSSSTPAPTPSKAIRGDEVSWDIAWLDVLSENEYRSLTRFQRINQFPLMHRLTKKKFLAQNLNRMREEGGEIEKEYQFYPRSWILPQQLEKVKEYYAEIERQKKKVAEGGGGGGGEGIVIDTPILIVKPDFACEGKGIYLVDRLSSIDMSLPLVVQEYLPRPFLLSNNRMKFDLRLYVLITSVTPLSIFLFDDGLTRFCTDEYIQPKFGKLGTTFQHLTNYAVNKKNSEKFIYNSEATESDVGNKWSVKILLEKLRHEGRNVDQLWFQIGDLITKSILSSLGTLQHAYKTTFSGPLDFDGGCCFQFLGFDILITEEFQPMLIEINRNCSLKCDTPLDQRIKVRAIKQTLRMIDPRAPYRMKKSTGIIVGNGNGNGTSAGVGVGAGVGKGADYKEKHHAAQNARYRARMEYEDECVRKFQEQTEGGWKRIYPLVQNTNTNTNEDGSSSSSSQMSSSSIPSDPMSSLYAARQSVYDRLASVALSQSDVKVGSKKESNGGSSSSSATTGGTIRRNKLVGRTGSAAMRSTRTKATGKTTTPTQTAEAKDADIDME